eukprot:13482836-Alexandrium_andersonii.AAC.1
MGHGPRSPQPERYSSAPKQCSSSSRGHAVVLFAPMLRKHCPTCRRHKLGKLKLRDFQRPVPGQWQRVRENRGGAI